MNEPRLAETAETSNFKLYEYHNAGIMRQLCANELYIQMDPFWWRPSVENWKLRPDKKDEPKKKKKREKEKVIRESPLSSAFISSSIKFVQLRRDVYGSKSSAQVESLIVDSKL